MATALDRFLFGLCFGIGFECAVGVAHILGAILQGSGHGIG